MPGLTSRLKLPWAKLEDGADIEQATQPLANALDNSMLVTVGTPAAPLPSPVPPAGCMHLILNTDGSLDRIYLSTGTVWSQISVGGGSVPIAGIMAWSVPGVDPSDPNVAGPLWRRCAGGTLVIADYPDYATIVGTTWGGNGTTTVGLPDFRGRTLIGDDEGAGRISPPNNGLGKSAGTEKVGLAQNEMPSHNHGGKTKGRSTSHTHPIAGNLFIGDVNTNYAIPPGSAYGAGWRYGAIQPTATGDEAVDHTHNLDYAGGTYDGSNGFGHSNVQPYSVVRWYIRVR